MQRAYSRLPENVSLRPTDRRGYRVALLAVPAVLTYLLVVPHPLGKSELIHFVRSLHWSGYAIHFLTYLVLTAAVLLLARAWGRRNAFWLALLAAHALLTETVQAWVPSRSFDLWDAAANVGGIAVAYLLWELGRRLVLGSRAQLKSWPHLQRES